MCKNNGNGGDASSLRGSGTQGKNACEVLVDLPLENYKIVTIYIEVSNVKYGDGSSPRFEFYDKNKNLISLLPGQTNKFNPDKLAKNKSYTHTYYINASKNQEIKVKAIGGNDGLNYKKLKITFNEIDHIYTKVDSSYKTFNSIKKAKNDNTVGWLSKNSGNKPAIRWYTNILNFDPISVPKTNIQIVNMVNQVIVVDNRFWWCK